MMRDNHLIIAVDGYSSTGKSTLAQDIAHRLKIRYIDSGAMYRAVTLYVLRNGIYDRVDKNLDEARLKREFPSINIDFYMDTTAGLQSILLNGEDVEKEIRAMEVNELVSEVSQLKFVREKLVEKQRALAGETGLVMDGRDIGTVVFPDADVKIFLTATVEVRAQRRYNEFKQNSYEVSFEEVMENVRKRDYMDEHRQESPLKKAPDAVVLDNSNLTREKQLEKAIEIIRQKT